MKPIEELNISPWPWNKSSGNEFFVNEYYVRDSNGIKVCDEDGIIPSKSDACMMCAAPELYEALYDAELDLSLVAPASRSLAKVRKALAKAAGEEATK